jgi:hypothetical protein
MTAVDFSQSLLEELKSRDKNGAEEVIQSDILTPESYLHKTPFELTICMADTLPHLPSEQSVYDFFRIAYDMIESEGFLILSFRDYSTEFIGVDRFIPVQNDKDKIMTLFLEYDTDYIFVHDLVYEKEGDNWVLKKGLMTFWVKIIKPIRNRFVY